MKDTYKVGQVFEVKNQGGDGSGNNGKDGELIVLTEVRNQNSLYFTFLTGRLKGEKHYKNDCNVVRVYPPEPEPEVSKEVTITCEGKTTTISRESATKLNLI